MEFIIISIFCTILISCILLDISILYALLFGLALFCMYARRKGFAWAQIGKMMASSMKPAKNILLVFALIGMLTALWRASGTIPVIISYIVRLIRPKSLVLMAFLLNCGISVLTGTSLGTAATMGVICMTMALSMGVSPILAGGAILSGAFFGDRCSPVSTSALLVSELTETNIFENVKRMLLSSFVPFLAACALYALAGLFSGTSAGSMDLRLLFGREFHLHWLALLPAVIILVLSVLRINVRITMTASILLALLLCLFLQGQGLSAVLRFMIFGYEARDLEVASLLNGGGVQSMLKVMAIVSISSAYAGIFQTTGMLDPLKRLLGGLGNKITVFGGILFTAILSVMLTCNQTLPIMLTHQLWREIETDPQKLAIDLENSVVIVAPLVPWAIASTVPLAAIGAPTASLLAASFLYLLPAYALLRSLYSKRRDMQKPRPKAEQDIQAPGQ